MTAILAWIVRLIGWQGCLLIAFYVYEEGIPGAHRIPYLTSIPVIGDLTTGRVHSYAAQQVEIATAGMVVKSERDAIGAQLDEEHRRALEAAQTAEEFRKRYTALSVANRANLEKAEKDIAEDNRNDDGARVSRGDLEWLSNH